MKTLSLTVMLLLVIGCLGDSRTILCPEMTPCTCLLIDESYIEINCENKALTTIPDFSKLVANYSVGKINLEENQIQEIGSDAFRGLQLRQVNISEDAQNYGQLLTIDLGENMIHTISEQAFTSLLRPNNKRPQLQIVLENNNITDINFLFDRCLAETAEFDLENNPLVCDCAFLNVSYVMGYKLEGTCESPAEYQGTNIDYVFYAERSDKLNDDKFLSDSREARKECGMTTELMTYSCYCDQSFKDTEFDLKDAQCRVAMPEVDINKTATKKTPGGGSNISSGSGHPVAWIVFSAILAFFSSAATL